MALTYVCSPLSAPTRAEMLANAAKASTYMMKAEQEFGNRAVAPPSTRSNRAGEKPRPTAFLLPG